MRFALGMALLTAVSICGVVAAFEWLVKTCEPTEEKRKRRDEAWLLWQSGALREREK